MLCKFFSRCHSDVKRSGRNLPRPANGDDRRYDCRGRDLLHCHRCRTTTLSTRYSGPLVVNRSMTLRAVAAVPGGTASGIATAAYTILPAAKPTLSVTAGSYQSPQSVTISDSTPGAAIYYTVTGVTPTVLSTKYTGPITVRSSMTLQVIAAVPGGPVSPIASAAYNIVPALTPTFSVPGEPTRLLSLWPSATQPPVRQSTTR